MLNVPCLLFFYFILHVTPMVAQYLTLALPLAHTLICSFTQHITMASVVLTMLVVGTWLRAKLTRRTNGHTMGQHSRKYPPTGNILVDSLEMPTSNERTNLIRGGTVEREATVYGSSTL